MSTIFSLTAQLLLEQKMICEVSHDTYFDWLNNPTHQEKMDLFLAQLDRKLVKTSDGQAYFCGYLDASAPDANREIRSQFKDATSHLGTLVKWLNLVMSSSPSGSPLSPGDPLYESDLLRSIENSPAQLDALTEIARSPFVNSKATDGRGRIRAVLMRLKEQDYLVTIGNSGSQFRATGKWSWLYDVMAFIQSHEGLEEEPQSLIDQDHLV